MNLLYQKMRFLILYYQNEFREQKKSCLVRCESPKKYKLADNADNDEHQNPKPIFVHS